MKYVDTMNHVSTQKVLKLIEELSKVKLKKELEENKDLVFFDISGTDSTIVLSYLEVDKRLKRQGLGTEAIKIILEKSKEYNFKTFEVLPDMDEKGVENFYKKIGFKNILGKYLSYKLND